MKPTTRFRELIERDEILPVMNGYDALSANLIEQADGEVVYMSGSSVSTTTHAYPDVGMTTMTEMVERARQMVNAVDIPVFCDGDTGSGNPITVVRTVEEYESAGVAGIHIEDQTFPKKCGHFGFKAATYALREVYNGIAETGTQKGVMDMLVTWEERNEINGLDEIVELERKYSTDS